MGASVRHAFDIARAVLPTVCAGRPDTLVVCRSFVDVYTLLIVRLALPQKAPQPSRAALLALAASVGRATGDAAFSRACYYDGDDDARWTATYARVLLEAERGEDARRGSTATYTAVIVAMARDGNCTDLAARVHAVHVQAAFKLSEPHRAELRVPLWKDVQCMQSTEVDHAIVRGLVSRASLRRALVRPSVTRG